METLSTTSEHEVFSLMTRNSLDVHKSFSQESPPVGTSCDVEDQDGPTSRQRYVLGLILTASMLT